MKLSNLFVILQIILLSSCSSVEQKTGIVEILDPKAENVLEANITFDTLATGLTWSEGPLYLPELEAWVFSDVPENKIYTIDREKDLSVYLTPSGYTDSIPRGGEPGSNGLLLSPDGELIILQHGDRRLAKMRAPLDDPTPVFTSLVDNYQGKKFNSPNDGVFDKNGNLYFTDPPYGLEQGMKDPKKEIPIQGVYCLLKSGELLLVDSLSRPNGVALSPDESELIVAVSDPNQATWYKYTISAPGIARPRETYYDATELVGQPGQQGLPDGMKMHPGGYLFASGPGGIWVFHEQEPVARIYTGQATSNCAFSADWKTLLITADSYVFTLPIKSL